MSLSAGNIGQIWTYIGQFLKELVFKRCQWEEVIFGFSKNEAKSPGKGWPKWVFHKAKDTNWVVCDSGTGNETPSSNQSGRTENIFVNKNYQNQKSYDLLEIFRKFRFEMISIKRRGYTNIPFSSKYCNIHSFALSSILVQDF